jgi:two-component system cell cycle sensor histidine kinase/response regulator CckA
MSHQKTVRVLIAEDDYLVRQMIEGLMEEIGHTMVGVAADGLEAVEMTQSLQPDVVLMDIKMPEMDGLEATRRIYEACPTPVVMLTAYDTPEMLEEASAAGAGAYLGKPPLMREMEQAITIAIARFDDMMQLRRLNAELRAEIAERKRAEETLQESEQNFKDLAENSPDGIIIADEKGVHLYANRRASEITGYSVDELVGMPGWELTRPDEIKKYKERMKKRLRDEPHPKQYERILIRKDGTEVVTEFMTTTTKWKGKVCPMVVIRDITERKRAEERIAHLNLVLRAIRSVNQLIAKEKDRARLLQGICESLIETRGYHNAWIVLLDESREPVLSKAEGLVTTAEAGLGEEFTLMVEQLKRGELTACGRSALAQAGVVVTEDPLSACADCPLAANYAGRGAMTVRLEHGDEVHGLLAVSLPRDLVADKEERSLFTEVAGDIAFALHTIELEEERKRLEAQVRQLQKMEAIGQLAAGIAHDFNNLLTPIGGFADLLLAKAPEGSKQYEYLRQIKVAAERAAALTSQLRLFTRQAIGERLSVKLNSLVEETRDLLERSIPKDITIELRLEPELWTVKADPSQISQVLMNLCVNSRDAMPDGGTLTLETRNVTLDEDYARIALEAQPGRYVRLGVSDTGCGMSPEVQAQLFEPFFTTKEVGKGTGLGLAMVYGIVKGHDGFIEVYSQEGQGSTFHVYLPARKKTEQGREAEELGWPTGTETILVVDDEGGVRKLGQAVLEPCGYTVLLAEDGAQALEVYQVHREEIALVVLDVIMPQMNGLECLRRLREMDPQVKVLISTGYTARDLAEELVAEGALGVVEKPFQLRDFTVAVRTAIDGPGQPPIPSDEV